MPDDQKATIRRFLSLAAVALGLGAAAPDDSAATDDDPFEARPHTAPGDKPAFFPGGTGERSIRAAYAAGVRRGSLPD